jgi:hypothetical protein
MLYTIPSQKKTITIDNQSLISVTASANYNLDDPYHRLEIVARVNNEAKEFVFDYHKLEDLEHDRMWIQRDIRAIENSKTINNELII